MTTRIKPGCRHRALTRALVDGSRVWLLDDWGQGPIGTLESMVGTESRNACICFVRQRSGALAMHVHRIGGGRGK